MISLNINAEDINNMIKDAILKSSYGVNLQEAIEKHAKELIHGWNSPIKKMVEDAFKDQIRNTLESEPHKTMIREAAVKLISDESMGQVIEKAVKNAMDYLRDR